MNHFQIKFSACAMTLQSTYHKLFQQGTGTADHPMLLRLFFFFFAPFSLTNDKMATQRGKNGAVVGFSFETIKMAKMTIGDEKNAATNGRE